MALANDGEGSGHGADRRREIDRAGELRLGLIALDHALNAARWMLSGRTARADQVPRGPDAEGPTGADLADFEDLRERVRGIRNVITHFDDRIAAGYAAEVEATPDGITARQRGITFSLGFVEWERWLDDLERWYGAVGVLDRAPPPLDG
jgi:hypothetical protein